MFFIKEVWVKESSTPRKHEKQSSTETIDTLSFDGKYNPTNPFLGSEPNWGLPARCRRMLLLG